MSNPGSKPLSLSEALLQDPTPAPSAPAAPTPGAPVPQGQAPTQPAPASAAPQQQQQQQQPVAFSYPGAKLDAALAGDNGITRRGDILPIGHDKTTGKLAFVWPELARSIARGVQAFNPFRPGDPNDPQTRQDVFAAAGLFAGGAKGTIVHADELTTSTVSGRASPGGPPGGGGGGPGPTSAAGIPADASKTTFRVKPSGAAADAWHNVGTMDQGDLQRFYDQANSYASIMRPGEAPPISLANNEHVTIEMGASADDALRAPANDEDYGSAHDEALGAATAAARRFKDYPDAASKYQAAADFLRDHPAGSMTPELQGQYDQLAQDATNHWETVLKPNLDNPGANVKALNVTEENSPELHQGIGQFNIANFKAPGDVPLFMRAALDNIPAQARPMSAADLSAQVSAAAEALGTNRDSITTFVNSVARDASRLPQAVGMMRAAVVAVHGAIAEDAKLGLGGFEDTDLENARGHFDNPPVGPLSPEEGRSAELAKRLLNVQTGINWAAALNDAGTGVGRALQSMQQPATDFDGLLEHLRTLGDDNAPPNAPGTNVQVPQTLASLDKFYRLWAAAGDDVNSRNLLLTGQPKVPPPGWYLRNSFANAYTGSLLAGKAIVKGYMMPAFMGAVQTFERTSGAALMSINPMHDAETRQAARNIAAATPMAYFQTMGDLTAAFRYSIDAMRNGGQSIIGGGYSALGNKQVNRLAPVTQELLDAANQPGDLRYTLGNAINVWPRAVFSMVGGHDELTKRLSYQGRVRMTAMVSGMRNGITGADLTEYVKNALQDAVNPDTHAANYPDILNEAARTSFINKPDGPSTRLIQSLNSARQSVPELRYILPVLDVPASAVGESIRRIPGVSYMFKNTREDLQGLNGDIPRAEAYGRWITGATLLGTGFGLSKANLLTGGGPQNPVDKQTWLDNGYQPYSFKIPTTDGGNRWVSYKDWEPLGAILGTMATLNDHTVHYAEDDQSHNKVLAAVAALAEYGKDKAAMKGVSDLLNFGDPEASQSLASRLGGSIAGGFVPAFVHDIRNATDPDLRSTKANWYDQFFNAIPGESTSLPPLRNVMGEPIHTPNDASNGYGMLPWTIASAHHTGQDPVTDELDKVYQLTGYAPGIVHPQELGQGHYDPRMITLESGQQMFDRFAQLRSQPNEFLDGQTTKQALSTLFASDDYKDAKYGSSSKAVDYLGDASKLAMIRKVFDDADKGNKATLANESPTAARYMAVAQAKSDSPDLLRTHTADELAHTPSIFKALNIDIGDYESKVTGQ